MSDDKPKRDYDDEFEPETKQKRRPTPPLSHWLFIRLGVGFVLLVGVLLLLSMCLRSMGLYI
jgi:hypothetical protein